MEVAQYRPPYSGRDKKAREVILRASDVCFSYETKDVLKGISLEVQKGTCMCLMGVNGCGKSTFLDCILAEHKITHGDIEINGKTASLLKPSQLARLVSYVPQVHEKSFPYLVDHVVLMGRNVHMGASAVPTDEDEEIVNRCLNQCGIAHLAKRPYTSLSGGEMQMVMLARALAQDAPMVLMDEPTAHLDFKNELVFLETVERLVVKDGVTVLMATHAPNQVFHLANAGVSTRVAVMQNGSIVSCGAPREVLTEDLLASVFGVRARLLECCDHPGVERPIRQIVPLKTIRNDLI